MAKAKALDPITQYARDVVAGKVPACRLHRLACQRHLRDLVDGKKRGLRFDVDRAVFAINFFKFLPHTKGEWAGKLFVLSPWQAFIVGSVCGWLRADGTRRFRTAYNKVPRKNGKSMLAAGLALLFTFFDNEAGAEGYCAATKRDQAKIVWGEAKKMVQRTPALKKRIGVFAANLHQESSTSKLEPLGADEDTLDGLNVHIAVIDELHKHKTSGVVDVLETAMGARRQPLLFEITTAGAFDEESICWKHEEYSIKVLEGTIEDDSWFTFITGIDPDDDWRDERTWWKANPNLGVSVKIEKLRELCAKAQAMPAAQAAFKQKHLNVWTQAATVWIPVEVWDECKGELAQDVAGVAAIAAGVDLSSKLDLTALVVVLKYLDKKGKPLEIDLGPELPPEAPQPPAPDEKAEAPRKKLTVDFRVEVFPFFWMPEDTLAERVKEDRIPYDQWLDEGLLRVTPGNIVDYDVIFDEVVNEISPRFHLKDGEIGYDPYNATQFALQLQGKGFKPVEVPQNVRQLSEPSKLFQALIMAKRLKHDGQKVLRWCVSNVGVKEDKKENIFPFKLSKRQRIDGAIATINGLNRLMAAPTKRPLDTKVLVLR